MIEIFYFDKGLKTGKIEELEKLKKKRLWIDIINITKSEIKQIKEIFNLHPLTAEDLLHYPTRIKIEEFPHYLMCVFYGIHYNTNGIELFETDIVVGKNFIISNHKREIKEYNMLKNDKERLERLFCRGSDFIFHKLLDIIVDNYFPVMDYMDDQIMEIEEEVIKNPKPELMKKILNIKTMLTKIKKSVLPQREKLSYLAKNEYRFISEKALPYFRDAYDHSIRIADLVDSHKETVTTAFEVYMSAVSNNMNEVMKVLSVIATIALPLTVISSIYGTNFRVLPGSEAGHGFWIMIIMMLAVGVTMIVFFRRKHWF